MKILFLSLEIFQSINDHNLYTDLLREFTNHGHEVFSITPVERRTNENTKIICEINSTILRLCVGNMQKTNLIEKGISTLTIEQKYIKGIKKYFSGVKFDLVLYATPPITFCKAIEFIKRRDGAKTYLMLKDIFPQNAIDLGIFAQKGIFSIIYKYFRNREKRLYRISDFIGCMSPANIDYLLKENPEIGDFKVGMCPNCIEVIDKSVSIEKRNSIRDIYEIPKEKTVFIYGGNLGKPQGIDYLIRCIKATKNSDIYFVIVGSGTERYKIEEYIQKEDPQHVKLISQLPRDDYDSMVGSSDVGMICLDHRFTIPNFPSRILSYMQAKMPIISMTDINTDIGEIIEKSGFGWMCESDNEENFCKLIKKIKNENLSLKGQKAWSYLCDNYDVKNQYSLIVNQIK